MSGFALPGVIVRYKQTIAPAMLVPVTTIPIDSAVRDRLKGFGTMGMTYTQILQELMDKVERDRFLDEIRHRAATNRNWTRLDDL